MENQKKIIDRDVLKMITNWRFALGVAVLLLILSAAVFFSGFRRDSNAVDYKTQDAIQSMIDNIPAIDPATGDFIPKN